MAKFTADNVDKYGGQGGGGYFSLKNDKDVATVRFMYNDINDVEGYAVHRIEVDGKNRYVNCIRDYDQPVDQCPFCRERMPQYAKLFIPLYNEDEQKVQVWERGKKFFQKISSICSRYPQLVSHTFEIERNGKAGDQQTTYEIYETGKDKTSLTDLPEVPDVLGGVVLDKTAEDMEYFLETGEFPPEEDTVKSRRREAERDEEEAPVRRSSSRSTGRRTPARGREDVY